MHQLIHDKGSTRHIARILHQRDEEVEYQNLWQEHDNRTHTTDNTIYQHGLQWSVGHAFANLFA